MCIRDSDNYRNDIYDLEPLGEESVGEALFALADTPRKLYVGCLLYTSSWGSQCLIVAVCDGIQC